MEILEEVEVETLEALEEVEENVIVLFIMLFNNCDLLGCLLASSIFVKLASVEIALLTLFNFDSVIVGVCVSIPSRFEYPTACINNVIKMMNTNTNIENKSLNIVIFYIQ